MSKLIYYSILLVVCSSLELFEEFYEEAEKTMKNFIIEERIAQLFSLDTIQKLL